jgi:hypothetical protein
MDEFADVVEQFDIIEHRHLDIEDGSLLLSGVRAYTISNLEQTCTCTRDDIVEASNFPGHQIIGDDALPYLRNFPTKQVNRTDDDAWRGRQAEYRAGHLSLSELRGNKLRERFDSLIGIRARRAQNDRRAALRRQHHDSHDALAIHFEIVADDGHIAGELARGFDDLSGRPRMDAILVHDRNRSFGHQWATE